MPLIGITELRGDSQLVMLSFQVTKTTHEAAELY
jgi:hypothetical protein